jgi:hypothetical protein
MAFDLQDPAFIAAASGRPIIDVIINPIAGRSDNQHYFQGDYALYRLVVPTTIYNNGTGGLVISNIVIAYDYGNSLAQTFGYDCTFPFTIPPNSSRVINPWVQGGDSQHIGEAEANFTIVSNAVVVTHNVFWLRGYEP